MVTNKKKIVKKDKSVRARQNRNDGTDKCPKNVKDCLKCKMLDCPEER